MRFVCFQSKKRKKYFALVSKMRESRTTCNLCHMSQLMRLWQFSSSVNSFCKRTCAAIISWAGSYATFILQRHLITMYVYDQLFFDSIHICSLSRNIEDSNRSNAHSDSRGLRIIKLSRYVMFKILCRVCQIQNTFKTFQVCNGNSIKRLNVWTKLYYMYIIISETPCLFVKMAVNMLKM